MELFVLVRIVIFITFSYILLNILHDNLLMIKLVNSYSYSYLWNILKFKNRKILSELSEIQIEDNEIEDFIVRNNVLYSNDFLNIIDPLLFENYDNINLEEYILNYDDKKEEGSSNENFSISKCDLYNNHGDKKLENILEISHDNISNKLPRMIFEEGSDGILNQLFDEHCQKTSSTLTNEMTEEVKDKISDEIFVHINDELSEEICDEILENMYKQLCNIMEIRGLEKKLEKDKEKHIESNIKRYYSSNMIQETDKRANEKCISKEHMECVIKLILEKNKAQEGDVSLSSELEKMTKINVDEDTREVIKVVQEESGKEYSKYEEGKSKVNLIKGLTDRILQKVLKNEKDEILRKESKLGIENNTIDVYNKGTDYAKGTIQIDSDISKMTFKKNYEESKEKKIEDTKRKKSEQKMRFETNKKNEERKKYERINKLRENEYNDYVYFNNDYSYLKRENAIYSVNAHNYKTRLKTKEQRISVEKEKYNIIEPSDYNTFPFSTRKKERPNIIFKENDEYDNMPISFVQMNNSIIPLVCSHNSKENLHEGNNETSHFQSTSFDNIYNDIKTEENIESIGESFFVLRSNEGNDERNNEGNDERNNEGNDERNNEGNDERNNEGNNERNNEGNNERNNEGNDESNNKGNVEEYDNDDDSDDDYEESLSSSDEWFNDESSEEESDEEMYDYKVSSSELTDLLNGK
ncbi:Plasmodium exported protein, unknown function [Plasmodium sp. gorilla clade G3]|nr:Plasmodium exported protein, unknown function [Plasmodium sp. gorilla clade G3]